MTSNGQLLLDFDQPRVRKTDPQTSKDAIKGLNVTSIRRNILNVFLTQKRPLATFQIAEYLGVPRDSISPHMKPLEKAGLVYRTGQTIVNPYSSRKTRSQAWHITQLGQNTAYNI